MEVLNRCPTPPFAVTEKPDDELANEDLRLQYRFLDLRRPSLQRTLMMRHRLNKVIRDHLDKQGFLELETPLLGRSTPEGARDYLVPSRVSPGAVVRPAAVAAAVQATAHGGRLRQVFPDRPLPARRGPAGRPPAGVHATRSGNVVRGEGRHFPGDRRPDRRHLPEVLAGRARAEGRAAQVRRRHAALRKRQAGSAIRVGDRRTSATWRRRRSFRCSRKRWRRAAGCAA